MMARVVPRCVVLCVVLCVVPKPGEVRGGCRFVPWSDGALHVNNRLQ